MSLPLPPGLKLIRGVWRRWLGPKADLELEILHYEAGRRFAADSKRAPNPGPSSQFGALLCSFPHQVLLFILFLPFPVGGSPTPQDGYPSSQQFAASARRRRNPGTEGSELVPGGSGERRKAPPVLPENREDFRGCAGAVLLLLLFFVCLKKKKKKSNNQKMVM